MKRMYTRLLLLLFGMSAGLVSCIHDETTGFEREISEITVTKLFGTGVSQDGSEANVESMVPTRIEAEVEQSLEGYELAYEWRAGFITGYADGVPVLEDSLKYISTGPVLEYPFSRVGSYWVRLRVYNEFGSTFRYIRVNVRAGMERGLLILSEDEAKRGRMSFCKTVETSDELLEAGDEDFNTEVWSGTNPEYELAGGCSMVELPKKDICVLSPSTKSIYRLDKPTLQVFGKIDLKNMLNGDLSRPVALGGYGNDLMILFEDGALKRFEDEYNLLWDEGDENSKFEKLVSAKHWENWDKVDQLWSFAIDVENELIRCGDGTDTGEDFKGHEIINCLWGGNDGVCVISREKATGKVCVTRYEKFESNWGVGDDKVFGTIPILDRRTFDVADMTLTVNTELVPFKLDGKLAYYYKDNKIYCWRYDALPAGAVCEVPSGKITCMAKSPDEKYLYVGVYDEGAAGLKGSVYIYDVKTYQPVKVFKGVADRPVSLYYKDNVM